jgi:hypothetical protein
MANSVKISWERARSKDRPSFEYTADDQRDLTIVDNVNITVQLVSDSAGAMVWPWLRPNGHSGRTDVLSLLKIGFSRQLSLLKISP